MMVDSDRLRMCLRIIRTQNNDELTVVPTDDGWTMSAVSPDHTTLATAELAQGAFPDGYTKWGAFCVSAPVLDEILSGIRGACDIDISTGKFVVKANGYTYRKPLLMPQESRKVPSPETDTEVLVSSGLVGQFLQKALRSGDGDAVRIAASEGTGEFGLSIEDETGNGLSLVTPATGCALLTGEAATLYPLEAWANLFKALPQEAEVSIRFRDAYPAVVACTDTVYSVRWMCAPRIEE